MARKAQVYAAFSGGPADGVLVTVQGDPPRIIDWNQASAPAEIDGDNLRYTAPRQEFQYVLQTAYQDRLFGVVVWRFMYRYTGLVKNATERMPLNDGVLTW